MDRGTAWIWVIGGALIAGQNFGYVYPSPDGGHLGWWGIGLGVVMVVIGWWRLRESTREG